jgi:hypothetical protein
MAIVEHNYGIFIQLLVMECLLSIIKNDFGIITFTNGRGENIFYYNEILLYRVAIMYGTGSVLLKWFTLEP